MTKASHWKSEPIEMDRYEAAKEVEARGLAMLKLAYELRFGKDGLAKLMEVKKLIHDADYAFGMCMDGEGYLKEAVECLDELLPIE